MQPQVAAITSVRGDEAYGDWAYTIQEAFEGAGFVASIVGSWLGVRESDKVRRNSRRALRCGLARDRVDLGHAASDDNRRRDGVDLRRGRRSDRCPRLRRLAGCTRLALSLAHLSGHDDCATARVEAGAEAFQRDTSPHREVSCQQAREFTPEVARLPGVGQQQDDAVHATVALLEREAADQRLAVDRIQLGLCAIPPSLPADHAVPCALVAWIRQRHFSAPAQARVEPGSESREQRRMLSIPDGPAAGVGLDRQVKTDDGADLGQNDHGCPLGHPALNSGELRRRDTYFPRHCCDAQAQLLPREADLPADHADQVPASLCAAVNGSLPGNHASTMASSDYRTINPNLRLALPWDGSIDRQPGRDAPTWSCGRSIVPPDGKNDQLCRGTAQRAGWLACGQNTGRKCGPYDRPTARRPGGPAPGYSR